MKYIFTNLITGILIIICISDTIANNTGLHKAYSVVSDTTTEFNFTLCSGSEVVINGNIYDESNPFGTETILGANGCDSTILINLSFVQIIVFEFKEILCSDDSIIIDGTIYDQNNPTGSIIFQGASSYGCDSLVNIDLDFIESGFTVNGSDMTAKVSNADNYQWLLEGNQIDGATDNSWKALENGNYSLQIEVDGIICTSEAVHIEVTNVYEISQDPIINIYPNPIQDQIYIDLSNGFEDKIKHYEIFNLEGQLIQKGAYQNIINVVSQASGMFIFRLIDKDQNVYIQKLNIR